MLKIIRTITYYFHSGLFVFTYIIFVTDKFITLLSKENKQKIYCIVVYAYLGVVKWGLLHMVLEQGSTLWH